MADPPERPNGIYYRSVGRARTAKGSSMMYSAYVLRSQKDGKRYIGISNSIDRRLKQHNAGKVASTKYRIPFDLEYIEEFSSRIDARAREKYFKTAAGRAFLNKKLGEGGGIGRRASLRS